MDRAKKFGTFGGVFTPSILTILGVIMYMRLGWVVGNAGLFNTIAIILIAHIISITTGLSLSSIATDKKIKSGGIYYMLSRSLGLPIGGAIGVTLFLATALSISLYIVGFSESFLSVTAVSNFLGLPASVDSFRIVGTVVVVSLTIIAFISTSLVIRLQYFVLTAIVLSLVSIFAGLFTSVEFHPSFPSLMPHSGSPSPDVLFAIFFPAVTGFTVGVAMSGDLKNPKAAIPRGTLWAIFTGLVVYIGLATGFALFVDRSILMDDSAFLLTISAVPFLVLAGIWGATLSSALGGILGGPRIAQALALDRLAPRLLSKGYGINNEPRAAIIITFLIAQAGVLIGDLNTIARVVSMFFIAAYGFINLAFALESWASTDFRPSFKVPRWVGWLGFAASIIVMMQIDIVAMFIAFILIWLTWFMMKRREQKLDPGDVWQSVWSSVVRHSLHNMYTKGIEERNWKPNILLFSGNPDTRPHIVELGKALIANHGLLTIMNLKQYQPGEKLAPRLRQTKITSESSTKGIFTREYHCDDIYQGIETLAETYGFAGVEPNTIILGWPGKTTKPVRFTKLIKHIANLDLNLCIMHYNLERGFGKRKTIDIWWRGSGNNGNFAINLVKFLWLSHQWKDSKTRLLIENPVNDERENIYQFAQDVLDNLRINAEIVIINNEIEQKPFYDIVRIESGESDIIFLGISDLEKETETGFIEKTHKLFEELGTVVLIKASTQFKKLNIGLQFTQQNRLFQPQKTISSKPQTLKTNIQWPANADLAVFMKNFWQENKNLNHGLLETGFGRVFSQYSRIIDNAQSKVDATFHIIDKKFNEQANQESDQPPLETTLYKLINNSFTRYEQILSDTQNSLLPAQQKSLETFFNNFNEKINSIPEKIPENFVVELPRENLRPNTEDSALLKLFKWKSRITGKTSYRIKMRKIFKQFYPVTYQQINRELWQKFGHFSEQYHTHQQKAFRHFRDSLNNIEYAIRKNKLTTQLIHEEKTKTETNFAQLNQFLEKAEKQLAAIIDDQSSISLQLICTLLDTPAPNLYRKKIKPANKVRNYELRYMSTYPQAWAELQQLHINQNIIELNLSRVDYKSSHLITMATRELKKLTHSTEKNSAFHAPRQIIEFAEESSERMAKNLKLIRPHFDPEKDPNLQRKIKDIEDFTLERISSAMSRIPSQLEIRKPASHSDFTDIRAGGISQQKIEVSKLIHFIIQSELITSFQQNIRNISTRISEAEQQVLEISRLVKITLIGDKEEPVLVPSTGFFEDIKKMAQNAEQNHKELEGVIDDKLQGLLNQTSRHLSLSTFLKTADNLKLFAKIKEGEKQKDNSIKIAGKKLRDFSRKQLVKVWYDRSKRIVYAREAKTSDADQSFPVSKIHYLNEQVSAKSHILTEIPPYYQQLFLRKNNYFMDFWHGKPAELEEARQTIQRHSQGFTGALLVRGEHNSGKTFFVNYVVHKYLSERNIYTLQPPFAGSTSEADFLRALQKSTEHYVSADKIMKNLPDKSVIILEDLELWWEKTRSGIKVIKLISSLIEKYGHKIFFIVTVNLHAFKSIKRFYDIDSYLLSIIDCHPFGAEELKNIIMQRHQSGNMKFVFKNKKENDMRSWDYARLFNTYFNYTKGNVGLSLQTWMAHITDSKDNTLYIRAPRKPDTSVLNKLNPDTLIFLVQFILHKRLNIEKIHRIMFMPEQQVRDMVRLLKRAAIITEPNEGVFMLNPNLHAFIRERFMEKELL